MTRQRDFHFRVEFEATSLGMKESDQRSRVKQGNKMRNKERIIKKKASRNTESFTNLDAYILKP